jgi:hypothetical protein
VTQRLCPYRVQYFSTLATHKTRKFIVVELYNSGIICPMVATYSLFCKNLKDDTYVTEPNYAMRTSAMAQQFLATFAQEILSPKHQNKLNEALKIFSGKIQVRHPLLMI